MTEDEVDGILGYVALSTKGIRAFEAGNDGKAVFVEFLTDNPDWHGFALALGEDGGLRAAEVTLEYPNASGRA